MPIEIKELHIKAVVSDREESKTPPVPPIDVEKLKKEIIKECIEQIMEQLREKNER